MVQSYIQSRGRYMTGHLQTLESSILSVMLEFVLIDPHHA